MEDLEAASIDDVRDFYKTYYVPENATLVLVGDFDTAQAQAAGRPSTSAACRRRRVRCRATFRKEPPQTAERASTLRAAVAAAGGRRRAITSPTTAIPIRIRCTSPSKVLSDGQSSRIYRSSSTTSRWRSRVRRREPDRGSQPVLCGRDRAARPHAGRSRERLIAELERLKAEPISDHELQRTKNQFARDYILSRESNQQKALQLGARGRHSPRHQDRRRRVRHLPEHYRRPTCSASRAPISRPENRLILTILPSNGPGQGGR